MNQLNATDRLRAEMFMQVMSELTPMIIDALDQVESAYSGLQSARAELALVRRQVEHLEGLAPHDEPHRAMTAEMLFNIQARGAFVYFVEAGSYIKIGHSRNPLIRLGQIRRASGVTVPDGLDTSTARLLAVEEGDRSHEKWLHKRFSEHRAAGEWFEKNDRLTHYIQSIVTPA